MKPSHTYYARYFYKPAKHGPPPRLYKERSRPGSWGFVFPPFIFLHTGYASSTGPRRGRCMYGPEDLARRSIADTSAVVAENASG